MKLADVYALVCVACFIALAYLVYPPLILGVVGGALGVLAYGTFKNEGKTQ